MRVQYTGHVSPAAVSCDQHTALSLALTNFRFGIRLTWTHSCSAWLYFFFKVSISLRSRDIPLSPVIGLTVFYDHKKRDYYNLSKWAQGWAIIRMTVAEVTSPELHSKQVNNLFKRLYTFSTELDRRTHLSCFTVVTLWPRSSSSLDFMHKYEKSKFIRLHIRNSKHCFFFIFALQEEELWLKTFKISPVTALKSWRVLTLRCDDR